MRAQSAKRWYKEKGAILCCVWLPKMEVDYLKRVKAGRGITWRQVIYKGLGIREWRPPKVKNLDDIITLYNNNK